MKPRTAIIAGERVTVTWKESEGTVEATVNGRTYRLAKRRSKSASYWFEWEGHSSEAVVIEAAYGGYDVAIEGHRIHVEWLDSSKALRRGSGAAGIGIVEVRAPMPGKIVRVLRGAAEDVEEGQGIVVMEAMKMQNEIRSPKRGKIRELRVAEGHALSLGDLIARVE